MLREMDGWHGLELRHLVALTAIARERSFRGAGESLGYVQSAVSQQIAHLEQITGARLVERSRGQSRVTLTDAGRSLLGHAEGVIAQLAAAQADLAALTSGQRVRVGAYQSVLSHLLPFTLVELERTAPELSVHLVEALTDADSFAKVKEGRLDFALGELPLVPGPFAYDKLLVDPTVLVARRGSRLASEEPPTLAGIARSPIIANSGWRTFARIEAEFAAAGHALECRLDSQTDETIQELVRLGLGVALMPHLAVNAHDSELEVIELDGILPARTVVLYWHSERRLCPALESFRVAIGLAAGWAAREDRTRPQQGARTDLALAA